MYILYMYYMYIKYMYIFYMYILYMYILYMYVIYIYICTMYIICIYMSMAKMLIFGYPFFRQLRTLSRENPVFDDGKHLRTISLILLQCGVRFIWFINPINYSYVYIYICIIKHSDWSYK